MCNPSGIFAPLLPASSTSFWMRFAAWCYPPDCCISCCPGSQSGIDIVWRYLYGIPDNDFLLSAIGDAVRFVHIQVVQFPISGGIPAVKNQWRGEKSAAGL